MLIVSRVSGCCVILLIVKRQRRKRRAEMASKAKGGKKKVERASSNVFAMFDQKQIQEFKEAFGIIDVDKDQTISEADIAATWQSLGKNVSAADVASMAKVRHSLPYQTLNPSSTSISPPPPPPPAVHIGLTSFKFSSDVHMFIYSSLFCSIKLKYLLTFVAAMIHFLNKVPCYMMI